MSNEIIYCFNKPEGNEDELVGQCIYAKCGMFSEKLDACKLELLKGEKVTVNPFNLDVKPLQPVESKQDSDGSIESKLKDYADELDFSQLPEIVTPTKFMEDNWVKVMDILRPLGYGWVKDGKNSRWEHGKQAPRDRDLSNIIKSTVEVDVSEIEWNVKDGDNTVQARSGEKAWAFVMGYDKDAKKSTNEPKQSTRALHDYLQQAEHYCDGVYAYFMNKDASFFSREPMP